MAARRGNLDGARAALAGYLSAPAWDGWSWRHGAAGLHGLIAALRAGLPPAEVRPFVDAVDRGGPDGREPSGDPPALESPPGWPPAPGGCPAGGVRRPRPPPWRPTA